MTDSNQHGFAPRGAGGATVPARVSGVNETLLTALLDLVNDIRADRDRLLKELASAARETASLKVAAESYRDKWDKEHEKVLSLERAAEEAGEPRPTPESQVVDREKLDSALADVDKLQTELAEATDKVTVLEKNRAESNKKLAQQSSREVKTITRVVNVDGVDMEGVRRHLETARTNFEDDPDKCLRALNRAHSILTTSAEEKGGDRGDE